MIIGLHFFQPSKKKEAYSMAEVSIFSFFAGCGILDLAFETSNFNIVEGTSNFAKANLGNVILALAALFIMETFFLNWLVEKCGVEQNCGKSTLFVLNCSAHT